MCLPEKKERQNFFFQNLFLRSLKVKSALKRQRKVDSIGYSGGGRRSQLTWMEIQNSEDVRGSVGSLGAKNPVKMRKPQDLSNTFVAFKNPWQINLERKHPLPTNHVLELISCIQKQKHKRKYLKLKQKRLPRKVQKVMSFPTQGDLVLLGGNWEGRVRNSKFKKFFLLFSQFFASRKEKKKDKIQDRKQCVSYVSMMAAEGHNSCSSRERNGMMWW